MQFKVKLTVAPQVLVAVTEDAWSLIVESRVSGTASAEVDDERGRCSMTRKSSDRLLYFCRSLFCSKMAFCHLMHMSKHDVYVDYVGLKAASSLATWTK